MEIAVDLIRAYATDGLTVAAAVYVAFAIIFSIGALSDLR